MADFIDLPLDCYPIRIEFYTASDNKVLHVIVVDAPGAILIPGKDFFNTEEPIEVRCIYANDVVTTSETQEV